MVCKQAFQLHDFWVIAGDQPRAALRNFMKRLNGFPDNLPVLRQAEIVV
jgi:hypothetical protein